MSSIFDTVWEQIYSQGYSLNRYPWDNVVSFVYRYYPHHKPCNEIRIQEVGCGAGSNLWFAAREGFQVAGIYGSSSAITYARNRFGEEGLNGDFRLGDFTQLPFDSECFDLVIDCCAITCCGFSAAKKAVEEVRRVLHPEGKFICNTYSNRHSSYVSGSVGKDGLILDISAGTLVGVGQICFYGRREIDNLFLDGWKLISLVHVERIEMIKPQYELHAEWQIIAEKIKGHEKETN